MIKVAYMFNMNLTFLKKMNQIISDDLIAGQVLKVYDNSNGLHTDKLMPDKKRRIQEEIKFEDDD